MLQQQHSYWMYLLLILLVIAGVIVAKHKIFKQQTYNRLLEEDLLVCKVRLDTKTLMTEQLKQEILTTQSIAWCTPLKGSPMLLCKARNTEEPGVEGE